MISPICRASGVALAVLLVAGGSLTAEPADSGRDAAPVEAVYDRLSSPSGTSADARKTGEANDGHRPTLQTPVADRAVEAVYDRLTSPSGTSADARKTGEANDGHRPTLQTSVAQSSGQDSVIPSSPSDSGRDAGRSQTDATGDGRSPTAATAEDIRGPKALVEIPVPEKPPIALWVSIGGGVLLLLIAAYLWRVFARRQRLKSPPDLAMASLTDLEKTGETLVAEEFANRAAHTVRQYIAARFGLAAPRRTTEEFLRDLAGDASSPLANESDHLRGFLKSCDLAKFAGAGLSATQRGELVDAARGFVRATSQATAP